MTTKPVRREAVRPISISKKWPKFAQKLATAIEALKEDQYLILAVKRSNRFIQFAAQGSFGIRMETTSNSYLPKPEKLGPRQIEALLKAGWNIPTGKPAKSTPENDPDGSPNYFVEFPMPVPFEAAASLVVHTFAEILRVPHPGNLEYKAFDDEQGEITMPGLGLKLAQEAAPDDSVEQLSEMLLATLKKTVGIDSLAMDEDGDIGIRYGSALTFVRLIADPPYVRIHSRVLSDVTQSAGLHGRLNDINSGITMVRFVFQNGSVYAIADICSSPFVASHVAQALVQFCTVTDEMDGLLQNEFGGSTAFVETMPSSARH